MIPSPDQVDQFPASLRRTLRPGRRGIGLVGTLNRTEQLTLANLFSNQLRALRMTRKRFSEECGVTYQSIAVAMRGDGMSYSLAVRMAKALNCEKAAQAILVGVETEFELVDEAGEEWRISRQTGGLI